jgi:photosystem II stability/assembly factor-like uncharacterized protein
MKTFRITFAFFSFFYLLIWGFQDGFLFSFSQPAKETSVAKYNQSLYKAMKWRSIGPYIGGRATSVAGISGSTQPLTYYFGSAGGGVWKSEDGGLSWRNISDGYFNTGEVGSIAISECDPNVIYLGMGGQWIRANVSYGDGIYKSVDGGESWEHIWKVPFSQIVKIRIHPQNPDLVYAAVFGRVYGPSEERGVFRTKDGGKTWKRILFRDKKSGAIDLILDPTNPRIIYASLWEAHRTAWGLSSGGAGSGLFKSCDGGDTWIELSRNKGLPQGLLGKIGITVSPANPKRLWAMVEAGDGGIFRSDNGGETWQKVNDECWLKYRPWAYYRIFADPQDTETVYLLSLNLNRSTDGGRTWEIINQPHVDNNDLWIDPENPTRMINANDGGANVSLDGGKSWTRQDNQPTLQFYHVITDSQKPYRVYGSPQDQDTICIASRTGGPGIGDKDYYSVGGCEAGHIAPHPENPDIVYATCCGISVSRWDQEKRQIREILPWPESPVGHGAVDLRYRFQWVAPVIISRFEPYPIYVGANVVFKTTNEGQSWEMISPDLTTDDESKQQPSGGPITKDNTPAPYYCTIFAMAESYHDSDVLWVGSDDGLVHITRDGGKTWKNITPAQMRKWSLISSIEASPHDPGTAYLAVDPHELDDYRPDIYKTKDYGKSWTRIINGLPKDTFVRVVREDPKRRGLLYAGTETGVFVSFDDGANWQSLQLNLPVVPIHDLVVEEDDLVAATHGRSFWILDDLTPLYQITDEVAKADVYLFKPRDAYRMGAGEPARPAPNLGENPPNGSLIYYYFKEKPQEEVTLQFLDKEGNLIKTFSSKAKEEKEDYFAGTWGRPPEEVVQSIPAEAGMNRFVWDMRYPGSKMVSGAVYVSHGHPFRPPRAVPGQYQVKLIVGNESMTKTWEWKTYPYVTTTQEEFQEQFDLLIKIRDKISEVNAGINTLRDIKFQIDHISVRVAGHEKGTEIIETGKGLKEKLESVEDVLIQSKSKCSASDLKFPSKLDHQLVLLSTVVESADAQPTDQSYEYFKELSDKADKQLEKLNTIVNTDVSALNKLMSEAGFSSIIIK